MELIGVITDIENAAKEKFSEKDGDYIGEDGLLHCGGCKEKKQGRYQMPWGEVTPYIMCKCEREKKEAEEAERKKEEREREIERIRREGFPESDMSTWTFANDDMENEKITKAMKRYVENFDELRKQGKGLLLYGKCGGGKTYAACEVANALIDKGIPVLVTNFARILNALQGTFEKQQYIDGFNKYQLIVIDDLGIERSTDFAKEQVYNIIDSRYRAGLPMIITTNLTIDKIKKPDNIEDMRIYERIIERCFPIEITGINRRRKKVSEGYDDMKELLGL